MRAVLGLAVAGTVAWVFSQWLHPEYILDFVAGLAFCGQVR